MTMLLLLALACSGTSGDSAPLSADDTTTADTAAACDPVQSGNDWAWTGECPQMRTPCDVTLADCTLAIDYEADGGMTMDMPASATLTGASVVFGAENGVSGCLGTVVDENTIEGSCDGGCSFTLSR